MSIYYRRILVFFALAGLPATNALAKVKLVQSWADPTVKDYQSSKVITVVVLENEEMRRIGENAIAGKIKRAQAVPSSTFLAQQGGAGDIEVARRKVVESGFDSALVLRLFQTKEKAQQVAPTMPDPYVSYWSYRWFTYPITSTPGGLHYEQVVQLEVLLYSFKLDKLIWAGVVESKNPAGALKFIEEIAPLVAKELQKKGIVK
jgi:hypothetical protein